MFVVLIFLGSAAQARTAVLDEVTRDFKPLSGYVVMRVGDEFLLDQDAGKGVAVGDLFTVVKVGEKIVHPVTREVLGTLDQVRGVLKVTRLKSGYSYARPVGKVEEFKPGEVIRRYENIPAYFWDYTGQGAGVFAKLKDSLPNLDWQDFSVAQAGRPETPGALAKGGPGLLFVLAGDSLQVHDADFQLIHAYPRPDLPATASAAPQAGPALPAPGVVSTPAASTGPIQWDKARARGNKGAEGYQAAYPGFETLGPLPTGTVMAAFTKMGDKLLLATTDGTSFQAFTVTGAVTLLAQGHPKLPGKLLSLHWWQPTVGGPLYLAMTSSVEVNQAVTSTTPQTVSGAIFQLKDGKFISVREGLPYILGSFDRDGDGFHETLLGQNFDHEIFFGSRISELYINDGQVETRPPGIDLPRPFPVQGSLLADLTGDGRPEAIFVRRRVLSIYDGEKLLYESPQKMGGSLSGMTFTRNPGAVDQLFTTEPFEVSPVVADLDGDGQLELVAVAAEGSFLRAPGLGPSLSATWLTVLRYNNGAFVRGRLGDNLDDPIQGLVVDGKRALLVSSQEGSFFSKKGGSSLLALLLNGK